MQVNCDLKMCSKQKIKYKENNYNELWRCVSREQMGGFSSNLELVMSHSEEICTEKFVYFFFKSAELQMYKNGVFFTLFCKMHTCLSYAPGFVYHGTTYLVCWYTYYKLLLEILCMTRYLFCFNMLLVWFNWTFMLCILFILCYMLCIYAGKISIRKI